MSRVRLDSAWPMVVVILAAVLVMPARLSQASGATAPGLVPVPSRVLSFEQGRDTTTVEGKLGRNSAEMWVVGLKKLQRLDVQLEVKDGRAKLAVVGADGTVLLNDDPPVKEFRGEAPEAQDYSVNVIAYEDTAPTYTLTVMVLPPVVRVTEAEAGTLVNMPLGTTLEVLLECNASTGYSWQVTQMDEKILKRGEDTTRADSALEGAPAICVFRFHSIEKGTSVVKLGYKRWWDQNAKVEKTFEVAVNVKAP